MKVFLDDARETPEGWTRTYTVEETICLLKTHTVSAVSFDNDLGEGKRAISVSIGSKRRST